MPTWLTELEGRAPAGSSARRAPPRPRRGRGRGLLGPVGARRSTASCRSSPERVAQHCAPGSARPRMSEQRPHRLDGRASGRRHFVARAERSANGPFAVRPQLADLSGRRRRPSCSSASCRAAAPTSSSTSESARSIPCGREWPPSGRVGPDHAGRHCARSIPCYRATARWRWHGAALSSPRRCSCSSFCPRACRENLGTVTTKARDSPFRVPLRLTPTEQGQIASSRTSRRRPSRSSWPACTPPLAARGLAELKPELQCRRRHASSRPLATRPTPTSSATNRAVPAPEVANVVGDQSSPPPSASDALPRSSIAPGARPSQRRRRHPIRRSWPTRSSCACSPSGPSSSLEDRDLQLVLRDVDQKELQLALRVVGRPSSTDPSATVSQRGAEMPCSRTWRRRRRAQAVARRPGQGRRRRARLEDAGALIIRRGTKRKR